ncbi:MAG: hypothetical protein QM759_00470 [Terricaulis sp.]
MKILVGAAISTLLLVGVALAQTTPPATPPAPAAPLPSTCGTITPAPTIPDGGHATATQMHSADATYRTWATETETRLHCRAAEIQAADAQVKAAAAEFQAQSASARAVSDQYNASVQAFNARGASAHMETNNGSHRAGGSVSTHE